ncbi:MAG: F0F1 ATP synthase subunit alpha, partial [Oscillospiraceae bacterium]
HAGIRPAVNPGISVSRVGGAAQIKAMKKVAGSLKLLYSQYRELQAFAQFGSDLDRDTRERLAQGERIVAVLRQGQNAPVRVEDQVLILYAAVHHQLERVRVEDIPAYETELFAYIEAAHSEITDSIRQTGTSQWKMRAFENGARGITATFLQTHQPAEQQTRLRAGKR